MGHAKFRALKSKEQQMAKAAANEVEALKLHPKDTGSADVQIALLTKRIIGLTEHLQSNKKDHSSRRGLLRMVSRRRRLLDYLKANTPEIYVDMITRLGIRK